MSPNSIMTFNIFKGKEDFLWEEPNIEIVCKYGKRNVFNNGVKIIYLKDKEDRVNNRPVWNTFIFLVFDESDGTGFIIIFVFIISLRNDDSLSHALMI